MNTVANRLSWRLFICVGEEWGLYQKPTSLSINRGGWSLTRRPPSPLNDRSVGAIESASRFDWAARSYKNQLCLWRHHRHRPRQWRWRRQGRPRQCASCCQVRRLLRCENNTSHQIFALRVLQHPLRPAALVPWKHVNHRAPFTQQDWRPWAIEAALSWLKTKRPASK